MSGVEASSPRRSPRWGRRRRPCGASPRVLDLPWREAEYCALDFETTGLDLRRDHIVSYGAVVVAQGRVQPRTARYGLVRPGGRLSVGSITTHALRPADLVDAPGIDACLDALVPLLSGRVLLAHAAWIERAFLARALRSRGLRLSGPTVDTAGLVGLTGLPASPPGRVIALESLARLLGLPGHTPHHALGDALTTAEVFIALAAHLEATAPAAGSLTVRALSAAP